MFKHLLPQGDPGVGVDSADIQVPVWERACSRRPRYIQYWCKL